MTSRIALLALVLATPSGAAPAGAVSEDWLARAQRDIVAREYRASANANGLQAPNRAHGLRTYFDEAVVMLVAGIATLGALHRRRERRDARRSTR